MSITYQIIYISFIIVLVYILIKKKSSTHGYNILLTDITIIYTYF